MEFSNNCSLTGGCRLATVSVLTLQRRVVGLSTEINVCKKLCLCVLCCGSRGDGEAGSDVVVLWLQV